MEEIKKKWNTHQISCDWNRNRAFGNKVCDMNCENVFESVFSSEIDLAISKEREKKIDENTSDGYHTFKELYEFRKIYNACLFNEWSEQGKRSLLWCA